MQSTNYTDSIKKLEKDLADVENMTNVKKISDKTKQISETIDTISAQLDTLKNSFATTIAQMPTITENNVEQYTTRLELLCNTNTDDIDESISLYQESVAISEGLKQYYDGLKMEVVQLK